MTLTEFINFIVIDIQNDDNKQYGHNPFCMLVKNKDNQTEFAAIAGIESVANVYDIFLNFMAKRAKEIIFSIDFPPSFDAKKDFVLITQYRLVNPSNGNMFSYYALPYDKKTGKRFELVKTGHFLTILEDQFMKYLKLKLNYKKFNLIHQN